MIVVFHKDSHERHRLECVRADGSVTSATLETRSLLRHDITHFLVESKARLARSFYGLVSSGLALEKRDGEKADPMTPFANEEVEVTEMVVAVLQGALRDEAEAGATHRQIVQLLTTKELSVPTYLTEEFVAALLPEYRFFMKRWNALRTGESIRLTF